MVHNKAVFGNATKVIIENHIDKKNLKILLLK